MKRILILMIAALPLAIGPAVASAHGDRAKNGGLPTPIASIAGTVVSANAADGTFVADASVRIPGFSTGRGDHGSGARSSRLHRDSNFSRRSDHGSMRTPTATTEVTITTDAQTELKINHQDGTVGDLVAGDRFEATFSGSPADSIQTLVSNPAARVSARTPREAHRFYAFAGMVTAVDTTAGTVTVDVSRSRPDDLVPSGSAPVSFTVGPDTLIMAGTGPSGPAGASLADVSVGDTVAGGVIGDGRLTLSQVESTPLKVLFDRHMAAATANPQAGHDETRAMQHALSLLGDRSAAESHGHKKSDPGKHAAKA
jgi:hypothetical protein